MSQLRQFEKILLAIGNGKNTIISLAMHFKKEETHMSRAVNRLVDRTEVIKEDCPRDARNKILVLTKGGKEQIEKLKAR